MKLKNKLWNYEIHFSLLSFFTPSITLPPPFPEEWGLSSVSAKFCSELWQILISVIIQKFDVTFGDKKAGAGYWSAGNSIKLEGNWQWADKNDTGKMTFIKLVSC